MFRSKTAKLTLASQSIVLFLVDAYNRMMTACRRIFEFCNVFLTFTILGMFLTDQYGIQISYFSYFSVILIVEFQLLWI